MDFDRTVEIKAQRNYKATLKMDWERAEEDVIYDIISTAYAALSKLDSFCELDECWVTRRSIPEAIKNLDIFCNCFLLDTGSKVYLVSDMYTTLKVLRRILAYQASVGYAKNCKEEIEETGWDMGFDFNDPIHRYIWRMYKNRLIDAGILQIYGRSDDCCLTDAGVAMLNYLNYRASEEWKIY